MSEPQVQEWVSGNDVLDQYSEEAPVTAEALTEETTEEVEEELDLEQSLAKEFPEEEVEEEKETPNKERLEKFATEFKELFGVEVGTAVESLSTFQSQVGETMAQLQEARSAINLDMQRLAISTAWMTEVPAGTNLDEFVDARLAECTEAYSNLSDSLKARIAAQGSKGILALYNQIKSQGKSKTAASVPQGRAKITQDVKPNFNQEELIALKDDEEFWKQMRQIKKTTG